ARYLKYCYHAFVSHRTDASSRSTNRDPAVKNRAKSEFSNSLLSAGTLVFLCRNNGRTQPIRSSHTSTRFRNQNSQTSRANDNPVKSISEDPEKTADPEPGNGRPTPRERRYDQRKHAKWVDS